MAAFTNMDDLINVRDVMWRVEELREMRESHAPETDSTGLAVTSWEEENEDDANELAALEALLEDLAGNGGDEKWEGAWYPATLIRDDHFTDYARDLCEDIGDMSNIPSYIEIDWEATASNIHMDYTTVEFNGATFWYR
jgi:hypothetical protein